MLLSWKWRLSLTQPHKTGLIVAFGVQMTNLLEMEVEPNTTPQNRLVM